MGNTIRGAVVVTHLLYDVERVAFQDEAARC
jgi:hypothetical protein